MKSKFTTIDQLPMGRKRLDSVKAFDIEQVLREIREEGKTDSYLANCRGVLYQIFNKAEANDLILKNPVRFAEKCGPTKGLPSERKRFTLMKSEN